MKHVLTILNDVRQRTCLLLDHDIYMKATLLHSSWWNVFGKVVNKPNILAHAILTFMVVTLFEDPEFWYKTLLVGKLDSKIILEQNTFNS